MTSFEIMKNAYPKITEEIAEYILWERSPWPMDMMTAKDIYTLARRFYRQTKNKRKICELCDNLAQENKDLCFRCEKLLKR